ncbi:MAG: redoxin domain-containing protein [Gammaproteobacteria bacterium]|nr:redoxin domain-containing protein [Gammaproteobacteria bacterium]
MKNLILSFTGLLLTCATTFSVAADRVGDFALIDHKGTFHHMAWYDDQEAVVLMVQANGAKEVQDNLADFLTLADQYKNQGVVFMLLNPGIQTDREAVMREVDALGIDLPVLMDDTQLVAEALGVKHIGEAVIYNPKTFEVTYRGPVQGHLEAALQQTLRSEEVETTIQASGTLIDFPVLARHEQTVPSYVADVAPIIAEKCASCHRADGIAPFALDSHMSAQGWSPMIREVVLTKRMPPGQIDNKVGHKIKNEMNLTDADMQTLVHWVNAGAPVDGDVDPLAELTWPESEWSNGEPDLIVQIPPQAIPATGILDYRDIPIDLGLAKDVWVRGSELVPGDPSVVHHVITSVVPPEGRRNPQQIIMELINSLPEERAQEIRVKLFASAASGERPKIAEIMALLGPAVDVGELLRGGVDADTASIAGYAPGTSSNMYSPGVGGLLRAGSSLSLQLHYTTSGKETTDTTKIGIYFYPEGEIPAERMSRGVANSFAVDIPAQAKDHEMEITTVVPQDAYIQSFLPHMHFRGKRMNFTAVYPDGREELIMSVPNYSFNWQLSHELEEPLLVPAGTKIVARGAFDNSSQNNFNPDPNTPVYWGEQSWEEMFMGFYSWKYVDQGGE